MHRYELSSLSAGGDLQGVGGIVATSSATPVLSFYAPAKQTTCPCIGGPNGDILFVTTASNFFSEERYIKEPLAGHVFMFKLPSSEYYIAENLFGDVP